MANSPFKPKPSLSFGGDEFEKSIIDMASNVKNQSVVNAVSTHPILIDKPSLMHRLQKLSFELSQLGVKVTVEKSVKEYSYEVEILVKEHSLEAFLDRVENGATDDATVLSLKNALNKANQSAGALFHQIHTLHLMCIEGDEHVSDFLSDQAYAQAHVLAQFIANANASSNWSNKKLADKSAMLAQAKVALEVMKVEAASNAELLKKYQLAVDELMAQLEYKPAGKPEYAKLAFTLKKVEAKKWLMTGSS